VDEVAVAVARLVQEANCVLEPDIAWAIARARCREESPVGKEVLAQLLENATAAETGRVPMCHDTGVALVFLDIGQDLHLVGGDLIAAVNRGVAQGYKEGCLPTSMVDDPIRRWNTGDNTPAMVYTNIVQGDRLRIRVACKGGGAENMSRLQMLPPAAGWEGARRFIVETVAQAGAAACPPVVVGVGIGGNFDRCALLAKLALLRPVGEPHPDPEWAAREDELVEEINQLGVGPMGLGGTVTALAVHIEVMGCHIAALPVAVNIECHAHRHKEIVL